MVSVTENTLRHCPYQNVALRHFESVNAAEYRQLGSVAMRVAQTRRDRPEFGGGGNGLPSPPKWLHESGGFWGTRAEPWGIDDDAESSSHQQFDQKKRDSQ
jgi:hypothetical protein